MDVSEPSEIRSGVGIQVIARAADVLRTLQTAPGGLSQAELGERIGLARSTVHRILNALEDEGLVASGPRGRYRLGPEIPRLADAARRGLVVEIRPFLEALSREINETVDLSVLDGDRATFIDQVAAPRRLRAVSAVGESFPLHCTANGKALLASLPPRDLAAVLPSRMPRLTPHTITTAAALRSELEQVRVDGVAYDREEHTEGIGAVGAVVRGLPGPPVAVSVPLPAQRFYGNEEFLRDALLDYVGRIEATLEPDR